MKAFGRRSLASFLTRMFDIGWYFLAFFLAVTVCLIAFGVNVAVHIDGGGPNVEAGSGARMAIPVAVTLNAPTHRVAAPSLGIDNAQVERLRGTLRFPLRKGAFVLSNAMLLIFLLAVALWVVGQLRAVFRTLRDG